MTSPLLQKRLDRLLKLHPKVIDLSLDRIRGLLYKLGNPQDKLPPVIHVAGTNGKGSTIAFMHHILKSAGYKSHVYTSPHLVRFNERITLSDQPVNDTILIEAIDYIEQQNGNAPITFFEVTTAVAFYLFAKHPADVALLETGLGGRLDATNVISSPLACVLTPVSIDHQSYLGDTILDIAPEKAGIIKENAVVVIAAQQTAARQILEQAARNNTTLYERINWTVEKDEQGFKYTSPLLPQLDADQDFIEFSDIGLNGQHQYQNAATAITTLLSLKKHFPKINNTALQNGIADTTWPARLQECTYRHKPFLLDGSHNAAGANTLADYLKDQEVNLICGMMEGKQQQIFLETLAPVIYKMIAVPIDGHKCVAPDQLYCLAKTVGLNCKTADHWQDAFDQLDNDKLIVVAGSLYLAANVLKALGA